MWKKRRKKEEKKGRKERREERKSKQKKDEEKYEDGKNAGTRPRPLRKKERPGTGTDKTHTPPWVDGSCQQGERQERREA